MTVQGLAELMRETLRDPRGGARAVLRMGIPAEARWTGLALMAVGSALLTHFGIAMTMPMGDAGAGATLALPSPLATAATQLVVLVVTAVLATWIGRWAGGTGQFADALLLVVWLQVILIVVQFVQMVLMLLVPPLGALVGYASVALFFWLLTAFVAELHGFRSLGLTFLGVILAILAVAFLLALFLYPTMGP